MQVFIAGIMQGTRLDNQIDNQSYRQQIAAALQTHIPEVSIFDPWVLNPNSVAYDEEKARHTFLTMTREAAKADLMIAYLPQPSMGTAMEMWEAFNAGLYIIAVTPLVHHWAVRFTANEILPDLETLITDIANGRITQILRQRKLVDAPSVAD
jgi:hypothetical protein